MTYVKIWHAHIIRIHAHTEAPFVACHKMNTLKYGYCYSVAATASKYFRARYRYTAAADSIAMKKGNNNT